MWVNCRGHFMLNMTWWEYSLNLKELKRRVWWSISHYHFNTSLGGIKKLQNLQSEQLVSQTRYEQCAFWLQIRNVTFSPLVLWQKPSLIITILNSTAAKPNAYISYGWELYFSSASPTVPSDLKCPWMIYVNSISVCL